LETDLKKHEELRQTIGLSQAVFMGLGSILGTGVFVSIGIGVGLTGASVVLALLVAAALATFNGLSSAQLAACHPKSGGTYEYGYERLNPWAGFSAGWLFLCAKSASAATAALGLSAYFLQLLETPYEGVPWELALFMVIAITLLAAFGMRRSAQANTFVVLITLFTLSALILTGLEGLLRNGFENFTPFFASYDSLDWNFTRFMEATALMFVAYTGYGRIATLAEEVKNPKVIIPKAIGLTLFLALVFYVGVALISIGSIGASSYFEATKGQVTPLVIVAEGIGRPGLPLLLAFGAVTAMLGVLLNLILGLSRVVLAMSRRQDLPAFLSKVSPKNHSPVWAILLSGAFICLLVFVGDIRLTWSFSAFTVLLYYGITNAAALRLKVHERLFPRSISIAGLLVCFGLAFWVETQIWVFGLGLLALGCVWRFFFKKLAA
jgi:basic amino acid/polyamine antiporter, APA family